MAIEKAAVIGAGLMGGAIAAHIANAGHDVVLLDIVPEGGGNRNALAEGAVARMLKDDPAPFMDRADAKRIATGNVEDHLHLLEDADWIVEAVTERVEIKQSVYRRIDSARKTGAIVRYGSTFQASPRGESGRRFFSSTWLSASQPRLMFC